MFVLSFVLVFIFDIFFLLAYVDAITSAGVSGSAIGLDLCSIRALRLLGCGFDVRSSPAVGKKFGVAGWVHFLVNTTTLCFRC